MTNTEKMTDKVRKLLNLAERAATIHEAEAFTAKATDLMVRYSIDEALLAKDGKSETQIVHKVFTVTGYAKAKIQLLYSVASAMGCKMVLYSNTKAGWSTAQAEVTGFESDVAGVEALFASLQMQVVSEADKAFKRTVGQHGRSFRQAFILGFAGKIGTRLYTQRTATVAEAEVATPGSELAIVDRSAAVEVAFKAKHGKTGKATAPRLSSNSGYRDGVTAGGRANIGNTALV